MVYLGPFGASFGWVGAPYETFVCTPKPYAQVCGKRELCDVTHKSARLPGAPAHHPGLKETGVFKEWAVATLGDAP